MSPPPGIVLLLIYVNDIVIIGSDSALLTQLQHLKASFNMKDLGPLQYFLGLEVNLKLCQEEADLLSDPSLYRQLVESLNYLTITCLDIFLLYSR